MWNKKNLMYKLSKFWQKSILFEVWLALNSMIFYSYMLYNSLKTVKYCKYIMQQDELISTMQIISVVKIPVHWHRKND